MSKNFEVKSKKALFLNGEQVTDFEWDHFDIDNIHEIIVATNDEKNFALFNLDGDLLFQIEECINYEITSKYILVKTMYIDLPLYGLISFEGKILLPLGFMSITGTTNEDILKIKMCELIQGYYIISTGQSILNAEDFKSDIEEEYRFLIENKWKKYKLVKGNYECIN